MIGIYKTIDSVITRIEQVEEGCWVNLVNPTEEEIKDISNSLSLDAGFLKSALDEEETSRIETEDSDTLIIVDIPYVNRRDNFVKYETVPLSIVITSEYIITVCLKESAIIKDFTEGRTKNVFTNLKTRFVFQLLYKIAAYYLSYLHQIDKMSSHIEKQLHVSTKNKELIQLLDLQKSLIFFSTSLKANDVTLEKIMRGRYLKLYEDDQDLLEDVLVEIKQAIEMTSIYSNILTGTMDAFASVISNNLNMVMKKLTSVTILMAIPTMVASFYGMNVSGLPLPNFWFTVAISVVITGVSGLILYKKHMF